MGDDGGQSSGSEGGRAQAAATKHCSQAAVVELATQPGAQMTTHGHSKKTGTYADEISIFHQGGGFTYPSSIGFLLPPDIGRLRAHSR